MSTAPRTASQLAAALVVDTCVPIVKGDWNKKASVQGVELLPDQRARLGFPADGLATVYEIGDAQVFMHFLGPTATVLYTRGDTDKGVSTIDAALKKAYPTLKQMRDIDHPRGGKKKLRVYEGDLSADRHCTVEVDYPAAGGDPKVVVRITAYQRRGATNKKGLH